MVNTKGHPHFHLEHNLVRIQTKVHLMRQMRKGDLCLFIAKEGLIINNNQRVPSSSSLTDRQFDELTQNFIHSRGHKQIKWASTKLLLLLLRRLLPIRSNKCKQVKLEKSVHDKFVIPVCWVWETFFFSIWSTKQLQHRFFILPFNTWCCRPSSRHRPLFSGKTFPPPIPCGDYCGYSGNPGCNWHVLSFKWFTPLDMLFMHLTIVTPPHRS